MKDLRERCEEFCKTHGEPEFRQYLLLDLESFAREIRNEALEQAAQACKDECTSRTELVKKGHQYPRILLGEASGATQCSYAILALKTDALAAVDEDKKA